VIPIRKNRPKVEPKQKSGEIDPEVLRLAAERAKEFGSTHDTLSDTGFWLDEPDVPWENPYWDWFSPMEALDRRGDKEPLRRMLREFFAKTDPTVGLLIDDMFARYNLERVPNRPSVPIYDLSDRHKALICALQAVCDKTQKMPKEKAIEETACDFNINPYTLANVVDDKTKHASLRYKLKELERLKSDWLARVPAGLRLRPASRRS
jgi:hypothetical protein